MPKLTDKEEMFCVEYLVDLNATQSAIRAGYSKKTARSIGSENLSKPYIQERITELKEERQAKVKVDANYVLEQAVNVYKKCIDKDDIKNSISALRLIGDHTVISAFKQNVEHSTKDDKGFTVIVTTKEAQKDLKEMADKLQE